MESWQDGFAGKNTCKPYDVSLNHKFHCRTSNQHLEVVVSLPHTHCGICIPTRHNHTHPYIYIPTQIIHRQLKSGLENSKIRNGGSSEKPGQIPEQEHRNQHVAEPATTKDPNHLAHLSRENAQLAKSWADAQFTHLPRWLS